LRSADDGAVLFSVLTEDGRAPTVLTLGGGEELVKDEQVQTPEYEKPTVRDYGDLAEITAGTHNGNFTDATFPAGTPRGNLTFSVG
jgi:hypothetical protein